ncbi:MAG: hypothetical protein JNJ90_00535 [Saprospiraceae bacterium]|jgi:hypothetical protein|nr:hypothetical protein [Saprospiraceae bacterium]
MRYQLFLLGFVFLLSCSKEADAPDYSATISPSLKRKLFKQEKLELTNPHIDYWEPFLGTYNCRKIVYHNPNGGPDTSYVSLDVFEVRDSLINILGATIAVDTAGRFGYDANGNPQFGSVPGYRFFLGSFKPDSSLYLAHTVGGLMVFTSTFYTGKKQ